MGWSIECLENTLKISRECAEELYFNGLHEYYWPEDDEDDRLEQVYDEETGLIEFNPDHMEHQDFLFRDDVQAILKKHKVNGEVLWTSADGDNCGENWGYRFKDGECTRLKGTVLWVEDNSDDE